MAWRNLPEMPNAPILELYGQRKRFHVPFGMKPLLEIMSREVIKDQPVNIYDYLASFLEERARHKADEKAKEEYDKTHRKSWMIHRWSFQASSVLTQDELMEFLAFLRTSQPDANHFATIIQKVYRGHHAREIIKGIRKSRQIELGLLPLIEDGKPEKAEGETEVEKMVEPIEHSPEEDHMDRPQNGAPHEWFGAEGENKDDAHYEMEPEEEEEEEEEESDLDSRTYEIEDEEEEEPQDLGTTDEEQEESLPDVEPDTPPPTEVEEQHHNEHKSQDIITILAPVPDHENKMDPDSPHALQSVSENVVDQEDHREDGHGEN